jgi:hypothetical protein
MAHITLAQGNGALTALDGLYNLVSVASVVIRVRISFGAVVAAQDASHVPHLLICTQENNKLVSLRGLCRLTNVFGLTFLVVRSDPPPHYVS